MEQYAGKGTTEQVIAFSLTSTEFGFQPPGSVVDILGGCRCCAPHPHYISGSHDAGWRIWLRERRARPRMTRWPMHRQQIHFETADDVLTLTTGSRLCVGQKSSR